MVQLTIADANLRKELEKLDALHQDRLQQIVSSPQPLGEYTLGFDTRTKRVFLVYGGQSYPLGSGELYEDIGKKASKHYSITSGRTVSFDEVLTNPLITKQFQTQ